MMGRLNHDQEQFFYSFRLDEAVPQDHPVREVAAVLDLSWVHSELAPYYPRLGRPSIALLRMALRPAFTCRHSRQNAGKPAARNSVNSQDDVGPASRPTRFKGRPNCFKRATIACGS